MQDYPWVGREEQYVAEQRVAGRIGKSEHSVSLGLVRLIVLIVVLLGCLKMTADVNEANKQKAAATKLN